MGIVAVLLTILGVSYLSDPASKATVVAAAVTVLGIVFSAVYGEISSYYKDRSANIEKKWNLIYPLLQQYYYPWISSAKLLRKALEKSNSFQEGD